MRFVVDVNMSHIWVEALQTHSFNAVHWSQVGNLDADDETIMQWAGANQYIVVTTDLDMGSILAASGQAKPSVVQFRPGRHLPKRLMPVFLEALKIHSASLETGALLTIEQQRTRIRILPIKRDIF